MKNKLTFKHLRKANTQRCEEYFHKINEWSDAEWACALAGEVGELCNFIKKRTRLVKSPKYFKNKKFKEATLWGYDVNKMDGQNHLGLILMTVRNILVK